LDLAAASEWIQSPKVRIFGSDSLGATCYAFTNMSGTLGGHIAAKEIEDLEDAWPGFSPRGKVGSV